MPLRLRSGAGGNCQHVLPTDSLHCDAELQIEAHEGLFGLRDARASGLAC